MKFFITLLALSLSVSSCIKFSKVKVLTCEQKDVGYLKVTAQVVGREQVYEKVHYNLCEAGPEGQVCADTAVADVLFELKLQQADNDKVFLPVRMITRRDGATEAKTPGSDFSEQLNTTLKIGELVQLRFSCLAQIDDPSTFSAGAECSSFPIYADSGAGLMKYMKKGAGFATYDECLLREKFPLKLPF